MPRKPDNVLREGDRFVIVKPTIVKRWGYPKCINDYLDKIRDEISPFLLEKFGIGLGLGYNKAPLPLHREHAIFKAIASELLIKDRFGGNKRSLHLEERPELKDQEFSVIRRRRTYEGTYCGGYYSGGYETPPEWEPSYLSVSACHNLIKFGPVLRKTGPFSQVSEELWIQPENVKKVETRSEYFRRINTYR